MKKDFLTVTPDSGLGDKTVTAVASENIGGKRSTSIKISGGGISRTISISQNYNQNPVLAPNGVYILHANGKVYTKKDWDTSWNNNAVGVAVKTAKCSFVIAPEEQSPINWGGFGTTINGCTTTTNDSVAKSDFKGRTNTKAIVTQLGYSKEMYAARYCSEYTFKNGKEGYLPALGELYEAYQNKSEIDACMALIGGKAMYNDSFKNQTKWSSTEFGIHHSWIITFNNLFIDSIEKTNGTPTNACARPFAALI